MSYRRLVITITTRVWALADSSSTPPPCTTISCLASPSSMRNGPGKEVLLLVNTTSRISRTVVSNLVPQTGATTPPGTLETATTWIVSTASTWLRTRPTTASEANSPTTSPATVTCATSSALASTTSPTRSQCSATASTDNSSPNKPPHRFYHLKLVPCVQAQIPPYRSSGTTHHYEWAHKFVVSQSR